VPYLKSIIYCIGGQNKCCVDCGGGDLTLLGGGGVPWGLARVAIPTWGGQPIGLRGNGGRGLWCSGMMGSTE